MKVTEKIIKNLQKANTLEEYNLATKACNKFFIKANEDDKAVIKAAIHESIQRIRASVKVLHQETEKIIAEYHVQKNVIIELDNKKYPLSEWVTIKDYCKKFEIKSTSNIANWIKRGIVPSENIVEIQGLNNLKLIKAVPYLP